MRSRHKIFHDYLSDHKHLKPRKIKVQYDNEWDAFRSFHDSMWTDTESLKLLRDECRHHTGAILVMERDNRVYWLVWSSLGTRRVYVAVITKGNTHTQTKNTNKQ